MGMSFDDSIPNYLDWEENYLRQSVTNDNNNIEEIIKKEEDEE